MRRQPIMLLMTALLIVSSCSGDDDQDAGSVEDGVVSTLPPITSSPPTTAEISEPPADLATYLGACIDDPNFSVDIQGLTSTPSTACDPSESGHIQIYAFAFTGVTETAPGKDELDEATSDAAGERVRTRCISEWERITGGTIETATDRDVYIITPFFAEDFETSEGWAACLSKSTF